MLLIKKNERERERARQREREGDENASVEREESLNGTCIQTE